MDSFFSLFDPSEGQNKQTTKKRHKPGLTEQDTVKKKTDPPKGRRRGRRSAGKNETLPEESSFLCEPNLSTEILVKDSSYFENYFEANKRDGDKLSSITEQKSDSEKKVDSEKKPRRRHSNRKTRRKRTKRSPSKDAVTPNKTWNNLYQVQKRVDENIGKNVNDLSKKETNVSEDKDGNSAFSGYNVIDRLEKVSLKDDVYMAGDFNEADLDNDMFYSSDGFDDFANDSTSEPDDSGDEVYGCLPPEPRFGNVEYKLQLVSLCERRFQHLVTQLKWRLVSGGGRAVYVLGVRDCGALVGLRPRALRASLCALRRMAAVLPAALGRVTARRVAPGRAVAEVTVRRLADPKQSVELRVAVMGANEAGKSTLIGVLTQGELDNGRGSARLNMFRHLHEVKSGRTSSLSHEILGFDVQGNVVNYGCSELMTAERIGERSAKLVSFLDLAGHSKYQRTTLHGLTGYSPHYAMLVISATGGITGITEEHISVLTALELPFFAVISKWELAPAALPALMRRLAAALAPAGKKPLLITDENMARNCVAPAQRILDSIDKDSDQEDDGPQCDHIPVFPVSSVRGNGLNALHAYLLALQPRDLDVQRDLEEDTCEFQIDEIFHVGDSSAPVVGGLLTRGHIREGDQLIIGPMESGEFVPVTVGSVYRNRVACGGARAGHCASLGLRPGPRPRPGMVLLARPDAGPRPRHHCCLHGNIRDLQTLEKSKLNKDEKRKNKNLLVDIIQVNLSKEDDKLLKTPEDECVCPDRVALEDPNNPRGCIYFQASVHVLRHATAIYPGFQCTVHVGNVRQTAIIEGIMSRNNLLRAGEEASVLFRFVRCPEYLVKGRRLLFTAGLGTRATGRVTQTFPHYP